MRSLRVLGPCDNVWDAMEPREGGRHCRACDRTVVDLARLTRREAEELFRARRGRMCGRVTLDDEGYAVFREESAGGASVLAGSAALAAALVAAGCSTSAAASTTIPLVSQEQLQAPEPSTPTMVPTPPGAPAPVVTAPPAAPPAPVALATAASTATTVTVPVRSGSKVRHGLARARRSFRPPTFMGDMDF